MKILFDYQVFSFQKYGGISRYFFELIKNCDNEIPVLFSENSYLQNYKINIFSININLKYKSKIYLILNKLYFKYKIKNINYDIFHPTYYDDYFLDCINEKPFVLTIHDMIHEKFPELFSKSDSTAKRKKKLASKANKIIAVSENTKRDIIEILGIPAEKIEVVYHGNSMPILNYNQTKILDLPKKYILFVGIRNSYKNFERFVKGIQDILLKDSNLYVVCAGGGKFTKEEEDFFSFLNINRQFRQYDINDKELAYLYHNAQLFVFPSIYEGFGIPLLEAFACRCPIVCSDNSCFPEIAKDAAHYFNPYNEESIKNTILEIIDNSNLKSLLIKKGKERLREFSWEKTVIKTQKVYETILNEI